MVELKTLKDLDTQTIGYGFDETERDDRLWVLVDDLKEVAIKWIKYLERVQNETKKIMESPYRELVSTQAEIKWIKSFFNITDEELK